jgi:hypothetical protein
MREPERSALTRAPGGGCHHPCNPSLGPLTVAQGIFSFTHEVPIFVSVPELQGAWATGKTIEEARKERISVLQKYRSGRKDQQICLSLPTE